MNDMSVPKIDVQTFPRIEDVNHTNIPPLGIDHTRSSLKDNEWEVPLHLVNPAIWAGRFAAYLLQCSGTEETEAQMTVMGETTRLMFQMASGRLPAKHERVVVAMPTGYGKTTTAIAFMVALHRYGIEDISVAVSSNRIEDLAKIKRDLVRYGGPDILRKIGLLHSNQYDAEKARQYLNREAPLPKGYASEQAIDSEPTTKQFMLLTHSRLRNSTDDEAIDRWNTFNGKTRDIVIYDESLLPADVMSFNLKTFSTQVGAHTGSLRFIFGNDDIPVQKERDEWLRAVEALFVTEAAKVGDDEPVICKIPTLTEEKLASFKATPYLEGVDPRTLDACLDFAGASVRILRGQGEYLASYEVRVHPKLKKVVILDASYPIRSLAQHPSTTPIYKLGGRYSQTLRPYMGNEADGRMKDHSRVTIAIMEGRWGRSGIEDDLGKNLVGKKPKSKLVEDVVTVIKRVVRQDQGVLVFTYKAGSGKEEIDQGKLLKDALIDAGVDVDARLPNGKPRISITTWGNETGTNDYAYCEHVILAGVLQLPEHTLVGGYLASKDDLRADVDGSKLFDIQASEGSHLIYQALSRGASRRVELKRAKNKDGTVGEVVRDRHGNAVPAAGRMAAWIVVPGNMRKKIEGHLKTVMPGAAFANWTGTYGGGKRPEGVISGAVKAAKVVLEEQAAEGVEKVSSRRLKGLMPAEHKGMAKMSWARTVKELHEDRMVPWELVGQSLVRVGLEGYGFED